MNNEEIFQNKLQNPENLQHKLSNQQENASDLEVSFSFEEKLSSTSSSEFILSEENYKGSSEDSSEKGNSEEMFNEGISKISEDSSAPRSRKTPGEWLKETTKKATTIFTQDGEPQTWKEMQNSSDCD